MDERLTELEIKLGFAEHLLEELNRTVFLQQQQIEALQRELKALRQQVQASLPEERENLRDQIPPHY